MILELEKFGKFENKSYELSSNITLFFGENESGKTTIFDALMCNITNDKKASTSFIKYIKYRYGSDIKTKLNPPLDENIKMNSQAYQNIYAIQQSKIILELSDLNKDAKDWQQSIKMKLFSSDIDITKLIADVKSERDGRSGNSINPRILELQKEKKNLEMDIEKLYSLSDEKNKKLSSIEDSKKNIEDINKTIKAKELKLIDIKKDIEKFNKIKERQSHNNVLNDINKLKESKEKIDSHRYLEEDNTSKINELIKKIDETSKNIEYIKGSIEAKKNIIDFSKPAFDVESVKHRIESAIKKIDLNKDKNKKSSLSPELLKKIVIISFSIMSLAFVTLAILYKNMFFTLLILPLVPFLFIKAQNNTVTNESILTDIINTLPEIKTSIENIKEINALRDVLIREIGKLESNKPSILENESELKLNEDNMDLMFNTMSELERELKSIFEKNRVSSLNEYIEQREKYYALKENYKKLFDKLNVLVINNSLSSIDMLSTEIKRNLDKLDQEHIYNEEIKDTDKAMKENEYNMLIDEIAELKENLKNIAEIKAHSEGELTSYKDIHTKIVELESRLMTIKNEIKALEDRKEAMLVLENMLERLNVKTNNVFEDISRLAGSLYNKITKSSKAKNTNMSGFDSDKIKVEDKSGIERPIENLSSATRDIIYLSMRMAILERIHEDGRIIILDDPFISFDNNRVSEALEFLKNFSLEKNIPIVLFTKDTYIKDLFSKPDYKAVSLVHNL